MVSKQNYDKGMSSINQYSEDQLVEQPASQLFKELGWKLFLHLDYNVFNENDFS